jgi:hypothetical protein
MPAARCPAMQLRQNRVRVWSHSSSRSSSLTELSQSEGLINRAIGKVGTGSATLETLNPAASEET